MELLVTSLTPLLSRCAFPVDFELLLDHRFTYQLDRCDKTAWFPFLYAGFTALFAQTVITLRLVVVSNFTSNKFLVKYPGYMPSRETIGGSPSVLPFLHLFSLPSGCIFPSVSRHDPVRHPSLVLKTISGVIPIPTVVALPDLHLDEFRICFFQPWQTGEMIYTGLSVVHGTLLSFATV